MHFDLELSSNSSFTIGFDLIIGKLPLKSSPIFKSYFPKTICFQIFSPPYVSVSVVVLLGALKPGKGMVLNYEHPFNCFSVFSGKHSRKFIPFSITVELISIFCDDLTPSQWFVLNKLSFDGMAVSSQLLPLAMPLAVFYSTTIFIFRALNKRLAGLPDHLLQHPRNQTVLLN